MADPKTAKWTVVNAETVKALTDSSSSPGLVYPVPAAAVPEQLHRLPGAQSYFISSYTAPVALTPHLTAGGEYAAVRYEGDTAKAYNYIFATSSDSQVYFSGPYKAFENHHFATSESVPVESLFGHPFTKGRR